MRFNREINKHFGRQLKEKNGKQTTVLGAADWATPFLFPRFLQYFSSLH